MNEGFGDISSRSGALRSFQKKIQRQLVLFSAIIALGSIFSLTNKDFLSTSNLWNIITQSTPILLIAFGMTIVIISGGIDLSVGAIAALVGVIAVRSMLLAKGSLALALVVGMLTGTFIGLINGAITAFLGVPSFIATLSMMSIARGAAFIISGGFAVRIRNPSLEFLYGGEIFGARFPVLLAVVICLIVFYFLSQTSLGRALHAIGGNPQAARFCGLNTKGLTLVSFAICGLLTGVSGLLTSSRMAAGSPTIGIGWELQAIAVVVFGGASLLGGEGSILGTVFAGVLIGMINNWMSLAGMDWWLQGMVQGSLLIIVVILNQEALGRRSQRA